MAKPSEENWAEDMLFDENLKEFAHKVGILVGLEQGRKLTPDEAYNRIKKLWKSLKASRKNLNISNDEPDAP